MADDATRFRNEFRDAYNRFFPQKKVKLNKLDYLKPWLNDDNLLSKIKQRNRLYTLSLREAHLMTPARFQELKRLTAEVNSLRRQLKKSFFARQLDEAGKNSKVAWRVLNDFIGKPGREEITCKTFLYDNKTITEDLDIAEAFCEFYTEIGPQLASKVSTPPVGTFKDFLGPSSQASSFFAPTSPAEVESLCQDLDASKGPGHDD